MLPLALELTGVPVLVIGAGKVGAYKATQLLEAGAAVTVIATALLAELPSGLARVERRCYQRGDLHGFHLVISATGRSDVNDLIVAEANDERIWLNVVDDPERSSFYFMALHREGDVTVAVSTSGAAPALAQELRDLVVANLPVNVAEVATTLRAERAELHTAGVSTEGRDWRRHIRELLNDACAPASSLGQREDCGGERSPRD